jgi:hypothetical protein
MNAYSVPECLAGPLRELDDYRRKNLIPYRILSTIGWLLFFLGPAIGIGLMVYYEVVLLDKDITFILTVMLIPLAGGLFGGMFILFFRNLFSKRIVKRTREVLVEGYLKQCYQDVVFSPKGQAQVFDDFKTLLPYGPIDYYEEFNSYSASYRGIPLRACDTAINVYIPGVVFSADHLGGSSQPQDIGRMVAFDLKRNLGAQLLVTETKKKPLFSARKMEMESIEFNKAFDVYSDSDRFAFYVLTPQFQEKLIALSKKYPKNFNVSFYVMGSKAYVVMENVQYGSNAVWVKHPHLTEEDILRSTLLLDLARDFIDGLKLYSEKYQEGSLGKAAA